MPAGSVRKRWSQDEVDTLRANYLSKGSQWVANCLQRGLKEVQLKAHFLGVTRPRKKLADYQARLVELVKQGRTRRQILQELEIPASTLELWLRKLHLGTAGYNEDSKASHRRSKLTTWIQHNIPYIWWCIRKHLSLPGNGESDLAHLGLPGMSSQDLFGECVLRLLDRASQKTPTKGSISTWVHMKIAFLIQDLRKALRRHPLPTFLPPDIPSLDPDPPVLLCQQETQKAITLLTGVDDSIIPLDSNPYLRDYLAGT